MHANPDAEQYALGCILMDDHFLGETDLIPEHFFVQRHQEMYRRMLELRRKGQRVDLLTMAQFDGEAAKNVLATVPSTKMLKHYEKLILDAWRRRMAIEVAEQLKRDLDETQDIDSISSAIYQLTSLEEVGMQEDYNFADKVDEVAEEIRQDDGQMKGISTGITDLDTYTLGWQDEDLIIVAARPSVGKTALALHTMRHAAEQGVVCTLFALEMRDKAQIRRMLSAQRQIDATKMRSPKRFFGDEEWKRLNVAIEDLKQMNIAIYDKPNVSISEVRAKVRARKNAYPDAKHLVIVDYLQLMQGRDRRMKRHEQVAEISRELKMIAREYRVPLIALAQVNRNSTNKADKRPQLSDLRESGAIEQDADVVVLLHQDPDKPDSNVIELILAKQRNGRQGLIEAMFIKQFNLFASVPKPDGR
jgi:replicative DNA helicase